MHGLCSPEQPSGITASQRSLFKEIESIDDLECWTVCGHEEGYLAIILANPRREDIKISQQTTTLPLFSSGSKSTLSTARA
jgi:hypothetical protein